MPPWLGRGIEGLSFLLLDTRGKNHFRKSFQGEGSPVASGDRDFLHWKRIVAEKAALVIGHAPDTLERQVFGLHWEFLGNGGKKDIQALTCITVLYKSIIL